jgi:hypothetical protein
MLRTPASLKTLDSAGMQPSCSKMFRSVAENLDEGATSAQVSGRDWYASARIRGNIGSRIVLWYATQQQVGNNPIARIAPHTLANLRRALGSRWKEIS